MVRSNPRGKGRKVMAILTTGWSRPDDHPADLWQDDRSSCLRASFSSLLIGLYEYLMKSRWNSIRSFTCCIFFGRKKKKRKWWNIIRCCWPQGRNNMPWSPSDTQVLSSLAAHVLLLSPMPCTIFTGEVSVFRMPRRKMDLVWRGEAKVLEHTHMLKLPS